MSDQKVIITRVVEHYASTGEASDGEVKVTRLPDNKTSFVEQGADVVRLGRWRWPALGFCTAVLGIFLVLPLGVLVATGLLAERPAWVPHRRWQPPPSH